MLFQEKNEAVIRRNTTYFVASIYLLAILELLLLTFLVLSQGRYDRASRAFRPFPGWAFALVARAW